MNENISGSVSIFSVIAMAYEHRNAVVWKVVKWRLLVRLLVLKIKNRLLNIVFYVK